MEDIVQDLATEEKQVQVFGIYRTNWTSPIKAKFLERIARTLWKRGPMTTGQLAAYLALRLQDDLFQQALAALKEWKIIKLEPRPWGSAYVAELVAETTRTGAVLAADLACERQKQGLPVVGE
jgi:hypothetical protein